MIPSLLNKPPGKEEFHGFKAFRYITSEVHNQSGVLFCFGQPLCCFFMQMPASIALVQWKTSFRTALVSPSYFENSARGTNQHPEVLAQGLTDTPSEARVPHRQPRAKIYNT